MRRLLLTLTCIVAALGAAGAAAAPERTHNAGIAGTLVDRINTFRAQHGLAPVRPAPSLRLAALHHTREQITHGVFSHHSPDGSSFGDRIARFYGQHGYSRWSVGETLLNGPPSLSPDAAVRAWLASPSHRRILLDPEWRDIGIVALEAERAPGAFGGRDVVVITSDFGRRVR
jgi:uncharacterized protein YkwD